MPTSLTFASLSLDTFSLQTVSFQSSLAIFGKMYRGLSGTKFSPIASTSHSIASRKSTLVLMPQTLVWNNFPMFEYP
jgi:hypothetical protein